jgi:serine/threonine protein kinase
VPNLQRFARDARVRNGKPRRNKTGGLFFRQGGMALTFPVHNNGTVYAFRGWFTELGDLRARYAAVEELNAAGHSWFVKVWYNEKGVFFNNRFCPTMCMEWVEGETLEEMLNKYHKDADFIKAIAAVFLDLVKILHSGNISHGDLQQGNIMFAVSPAGNEYSIKLVDYDGIWMPSLGNMPDSTMGLPGYQHPLRKYFPNLREKADWFSELVIYLSLLAIAENPRLWADARDTGRLLFDVRDFENPSMSKMFANLRNSPSNEIKRLARELERFCRERDLTRLRPLEAVVKGLETAEESEPPPFPTKGNEALVKIDWGLSERTSAAAGNAGYSEMYMLTRTGTPQTPISSTNLLNWGGNSKTAGAAQKRTVKKSSPTLYLVAKPGNYQTPTQLNKQQPLPSYANLNVKSNNSDVWVGLIVIIIIIGIIIGIANL